MRKQGSQPERAITENAERWQNLDIWKEADDLAYRVYCSTSRFPKEEIYGVTSQLRRAALSVPTNIVEGYSRRGDKELSRFVNIALGSLGETKYLIMFSYKLGYLNDPEHQQLWEVAGDLGRKLWKFYERVREP